MLPARNRTKAISVIGLISFLFGLIFGHYVPYAEQAQMYDALRAISALIFGVVGAWLAVLYSAYKNTSGEIKDDREKSLPIKLLQPLTYSIYIIIFTLIVPLCVPLVKLLPVNYIYFTVLRSLSFSLLCVMTALQFYTLLLSLLPFDWFKTEIELLSKKDQNEKLLQRKKVKDNISN